MKDLFNLIIGLYYVMVGFIGLVGTIFIVFLSSHFLKSKFIEAMDVFPMPLFKE